jgi:hypothetical protein
MAGWFAMHQCLGDNHFDSFRIAQDFKVGEPKDAESSTAQIGIALSIRSTTCNGIMLPTVNLDYDFGVVAHKIGNVRAKGNLLAKMVSASTQRPKQPPHALFRVSRVCP